MPINKTRAPTTPAELRKRTNGPPSRLRSKEEDGEAAEKGQNDNSDHQPGEVETYEKECSNEENPGLGWW